MSDLLHVATRKGLFSYQRNGAGWTAGEPAFLGEPVSQVLHDPRDGAIYAALRLGHFGIKLHRSDDGGQSWKELPAPAFPAVDQPDAKAPSADTIWALSAGGRTSRACCGRAWRRRACSSAATGARAGSWSAASTTSPRARSGSAAARTCPPPTPSAWTLAIAERSPSRSPAAGCGSPTTPEKPGAWPAKACAATTCPPTRPMSRACRTRT